MGYKHLSLTDRHYIELERKMGTSANKIAKALNRSQSTVSREIVRNSGERGYRHQQADRKAQERHESKPKSVKMSADISKLSTDILSRTGVQSRSQEDLKRMELSVSTTKPFISTSLLTRRQGASYTFISAIRKRPIASAMALLTTVLAYLIE